MKLVYKPSFIRQYSKLPVALQNEVKEKIELFRENQKHPFLKAHKLKGKLKEYWSFSVNYQYRIVFGYESKDVITLLSVGDHSIYD